MFGRLGDIHGRYAIYGTGFAIMAASAFFCGMAPSVVWEIRGMRIGRALETLISRAARAGVGVYSVAPFYVTPPRRAGLFLGYAGLDESEIGAGIERLAGVLRGIRADG